MSLSNYAENEMLDWAFTDSSVTRPTAWYASLHTDDPGETGANEVVVGTDADYVRKACTFSDAVSGANANEAAITWTVDSASAGYTIRYVCIWDALTTGNCLAVGALYSPHTVAANSVVSFAIGDLVVSLD